MTNRESTAIARAAYIEKLKDPVRRAIKFWKKVDVKHPNQCWEWLGCRSKKGYGSMRLDAKFASSHRVAYELANGPIPDGGNILHHCDNPPCCNPNHLFCGTFKENSMDAASKGRLGKARGESSGRTKITTDDAIKIRNNTTDTNSILAKKYGLCEATIHNIKTRKTWKYV